MRRAPILCDCATCRQLDRAHPKEGRQIAMFEVSNSRKANSRQSKGNLS